LEFISIPWVLKAIVADDQGEARREPSADSGYDLPISMDVLLLISLYGTPRVETAREGFSQGNSSAAATGVLINLHREREILPLDD